MPALLFSAPVICMFTSIGLTHLRIISNAMFILRKALGVTSAFVAKTSLINHAGFSANRNAEGHFCV